MRISKLKLLIAFIAGVGALDLAFTIIALQGGWLVEQNPIADRVLSAWGGWGLAVFKAVTTFIACTAFWVAVRMGWPKHQRLLTVAIITAVVVQSLLLAHWMRCLSQFL